VLLVGDIGKVKNSPAGLAASVSGGFGSDKLLRNYVDSVRRAIFRMLPSLLGLSQTLRYDDLADGAELAR
jgi:hypothetical protein